MEKAHLIEQEARTERKKPYEPPKVAFIPLKIEERLMLCNKISFAGPPPCSPFTSSS